jgi:hypothetical protein
MTPNYAPKTVYSYGAQSKGDLIQVNEAGEITLAHTGEDPLVVREKILALKDALLAMPGEHMELPVEHSFAKGMYVRKLFIPKGAFLIGKIHKKECINVVAKGDISILTETGAARVSAGFTVVSPAGMMKVGIAHEDTVFINVFQTDETDIEKLENEIACESFDALQLPQAQTLVIEGG